jgi:hypothetical protein
MASGSSAISKSNSGRTCSADVTLGSGADVEVVAGVDSEGVLGSDVEPEPLHAPNRTTLTISDDHAVLID